MVASQAHAIASYKGRVLVCDDEGRLAELTAGLLRHSGFDADSVPDGAQALERLAARGAPFDVLLLDLSLHGVSSTEVVRRLGELGLAVKVILTSGYSAEDVPESLMRQPNVAGYLAKPYPVERLVAAVDAAVEGDRSA